MGFKTCNSVPALFVELDDILANISAYTVPALNFFPLFHCIADLQLLNVDTPTLWYELLNQVKVKTFMYEMFRLDLFW